MSDRFFKSLNLRRVSVFGLLLFAACALTTQSSNSSLFAAEPEKTDKAASPAAAATPEIEPRLTEKELAEGWIQLFDGVTDYGWAAGSKADWKVADGVISVTSGEQGLLHTTSQWADFVLKVDFRSTKETNSGIFLRTPAAPKDPAKDCYELNIADASISKFPTGSFVAHKRGEDVPFKDAWQTYEVTAEGGHFHVLLDGKLVCDFTDEHPLTRGFIGLQYNTGKCEFRNIRLKPLGIKSLFNGKDLSGWKEYPNYPSKFTVAKEGEISLKNGKGQLETEGKYADFVFQIEVQSNGKHLNSGVFFRSIPGDYQNGYECQIQNGYKDDDRNKPEDCGTGGIYRRQNARRVMSDDFAWFPMTIAASGNHMAAWVRGVQVSDFTDTRAPNNNPRNGLRTEAGTIILQGHDPTTDFQFRNIRAGELPAETKPKE